MDGTRLFRVCMLRFDNSHLLGHLVSSRGDSGKTFIPRQITFLDIINFAGPTFRSDASLTINHSQLPVL